jgi:hypothetical protein
MVYRLAAGKPGGKQLQTQTRTARQTLAVVIATVILSVLPDFDAIPGILLRDMHRFHNQESHSLIVGAALAAGMAGLFRVWKKNGFWRLLWMFGLSYNLHVLMDFFTLETRGVMLFWPFSLERYEAAAKIFYGVRWSDGLYSSSHLITVVTEAVFILAAAVLLLWLEKNFKKRHQQVLWVPLRGKEEGG